MPAVILICSCLHCSLQNERPRVRRALLASLLLCRAGKSARRVGQILSALSISFALDRHHHRRTRVDQLVAIFRGSF